MDKKSFEQWLKQQQIKYANKMRRATPGTQKQEYFAALEAHYTGLLGGLGRTKSMKKAK